MRRQSKRGSTRSAEAAAAFFLVVLGGEVIRAWVRYSTTAKVNGPDLRAVRENPDRPVVHASR
jgi:hypothetical protein